MEWKERSFVTSEQDTDAIMLSLRVSTFQLLMNQNIFTPKNIVYGPVYNFACNVMCCSVSPGL